MKLAAIHIIFLAVLAGALRTQESAEPKMVKGHVFDIRSSRKNPEGVPGVIVKIFDAQGKLLTETITDEDGSYVLENVAPGTFVSIKHSKVNYLRDPEPFEGVVDEKGVTIYIGRRNADLAYYQDIGRTIVSDSKVGITTCQMSFPPNSNACVTSYPFEDTLTQAGWLRFRSLGLDIKKMKEVKSGIEQVGGSEAALNFIKTDIALAEMKGLDADAATQVAQSAGFLLDVYFEQGQATLSEEAKKLLARDAVLLGNLGNLGIAVEGHGNPDEVSTTLAEMRAAAVRDYLVSRAINPARINALSYGDSRPVCTDKEESCWRRNRRVHMALAPEQQEPK